MLMVVEWCGSRSKMAVARTGALKISPQSTKLLLLVRMMEARVNAEVNFPNHR